MKRYFYSALLLIIIGCLIYLSSVYLAKAESSFRQLAQNTEELETEEVIRVAQNPPRQSVSTQPSVSRSLEQKPSGYIPVPETQKSQEQSEAGGPPRISMDFVNANLKDVLKIFCQQSGLNFIAGENVELRPITLYLNNVSVDDALNSIVTANGLAYERAPGSNVFIVRRTAEPEIKLETKIYKLKHAFVDDKSITGIDNTKEIIKGVKEVIQKILTPNGDLSVDTRTNSLIVTDIPSRFELIEKSIKDLDSKLPQILIEAKIVEIGTVDLSQIGVKWSSLGEYKLKITDPTRSLTDNFTSSRESTSTETWALGDGWGGGGSYTETTPRYGPDYTDPGSIAGITNPVNYTWNQSSAKNISETARKSHALTDLRSAILSADSFQLVLSLLLTDTDADIISNPNIVTAHSREAKITVGELYPIPQFSFNSNTAQWEMTGFEYRDIGIILRVTPYADVESGNITLELHPEVSDISGSSTFSGAQIPIIGTRTAITNVSINNGDTLAIGGLIREKTDKTVTKVPLLGDIPFVGNLFKHKVDSKRKTNLIIFITPKILKDGKAPEGVSSEARVPVAILEPPSDTVVVTKPQPAVSETKTKKTEEKSSYQFKHR